TGTTEANAAPGAPGAGTCTDSLMLPSTRSSTPVASEHAVAASSDSRTHAAARLRRYASMIGSSCPVLGERRLHTGPAMRSRQGDGADGAPATQVVASQRISVPSQPSDEPVGAATAAQASAW